MSQETIGIQVISPGVYSINESTVAGGPEPIVVLAKARNQRPLFISIVDFENIRGKTFATTCDYEVRLVADLNAKQIAGLVGKLTEVTRGGCQHHEYVFTDFDGVPFSISLPLSAEDAPEQEFNARNALKHMDLMMAREKADIQDLNLLTAALRKKFPMLNKHPVTMELQSVDSINWRERVLLASVYHALSHVLITGTDEEQSQILEVLEYLKDSRMKNWIPSEELVLDMVGEIYMGYLCTVMSNVSPIITNAIVTASGGAPNISSHTFQTIGESLEKLASGQVSDGPIIVEILLGLRVLDNTVFKIGDETKFGQVIRLISKVNHTTGVTMFGDDENKPPVSSGFAPGIYHNLATAHVENYNSLAVDFRGVITAVVNGSFVFTDGVDPVAGQAMIDEIIEAIVGLHIAPTVENDQVV